MIKFRLYYDKDAETEWLNAMSANGWAMTGFFAGFYKFEPCEKGKYIYQVDFGDSMFAVSNEYREFMQDTGVEIVQKWGYWIILRKLASEGKFELYTDVDSSIEHYMKILRMFKAAAIIELLCLFMELIVVMRGNQWAIGLVFLIAAFIIVLLRAARRTNNIIAELKERQGEVAEKKCGNVSALLPAGMIINGCTLLVEESLSPYIRHTFQIIAVVFMLAGVYLTCRKKDN